MVQVDKAVSYDPEDDAKESLTEHFAHNNEDQFIDENAVIKTYTEIKDFEALADNLVYSYKDVIKDWKKFISDPVTQKMVITTKRKEQQVKSC